MNNLDPINKYFESLYPNLKDSSSSNLFKLYTAGYILEDGSYIYLNEYHGEDSSLRGKKLLEFSSTHWSEDVCVRIYKQPNEKQYESLENVFDSYLNEFNYCKIECEGKAERLYKAYCLYEDAIEDNGYTEQIVGNWTGWDLIKVVKRYYSTIKQPINEVYPQKNETKSDFINRFMRVTAKEYPDVKQRYAVANSYWDRRDLNEAYLDPEGKFWDYRTKEISGNQYIDTTRNEIRWVDDMLEDPEYYRKKKGYISKIIEMSPKEYFEACAELFGTSVEAQKRQIAADTGVLDNLTQVIKKYKKRFPIPFINIKDRTQEGRHRMYVLGELLGWDKKFPVLIIQDVNNKRV